MFLPVRNKIIFLIAMSSLTLLITLLFSSTLEASSEISKEQKLIYTNVAGLSAITLWGVANWDYFETEMNKKSEGWFSENTKYGGADKLGHFYTSYSTTRLLTHVFHNWGYSEERGALFGSLSSFTMMSWMEVGDSFSNYGFSYEDFLMNSFGCFTGYYLEINPDLSEKIDIRVEYLPDFKSADVFTDYDNTKYLIAIKLEGFNSVKNSIAKYLEFHFGYYSRNYPDSVNRKRNVYLGLGVNMSRIFHNYSMNKTAKLAQYLQVPYTYVSGSKNLNK